ncbi:unnamed protein product [Linum trigynum]|uniref:Uncharacterized protein n=1 Tax=Linum trigynum TaxID=586398 RepID=A0AAV2DEN2_9ROSI
MPQTAGPSNSNDQLISNLSFLLTLLLALQSSMTKKPSDTPSSSSSWAGLEPPADSDRRLLEVVAAQSQEELQADIEARISELLPDEPPSPRPGPPPPLQVVPLASIPPPTPRQHQLFRVGGGQQQMFAPVIMGIPLPPLPLPLPLPPPMARQGKRTLSDILGGGGQEEDEEDAWRRDRLTRNLSGRVQGVNSGGDGGGNGIVRLFGSTISGGGSVNEIRLFGSRIVIGEAPPAAAVTGTPPSGEHPPAPIIISGDDKMDAEAAAAPIVINDDDKEDAAAAAAPIIIIDDKDSVAGGGGPAGVDGPSNDGDEENPPPAAPADVVDPEPTRPPKNSD